MSFQGKIVYLYESFLVIIESPPLRPRSVVDLCSQGRTATMKHGVRRLGRLIGKGKPTRMTIDEQVEAHRFSVERAVSVHSSGPLNQSRYMR
ncbi:hypothetical protein WBG06_05315 [Nocardioides sp. CCNWLW239]|uniref:hypothetical protein n=1 Tax=Nocardioides sp. CCNWLW239 TaxID=3128902 RepID=UPI00301658DB